MRSSHPHFLGFLPQAACVFLLATPALAFHAGPPDGYAGDPPAGNTCIACHASFPLNSGNGSLQLLGLPPTYTPETQYLLTVRLEDPGQIRWGYEMTVIRQDDGLQAGTMDPGNPAYSQVSIGPGDQRDYIKQTALGTFPGESIAFWDVLWTAPAAGTGTARFYLAGNAANNNNSSSLDYIYAINLAVPESPSDVPPLVLVFDSEDARSFPNPTSGSSTVRFGLLGSSWVDVQVWDAAGRRVRTLHRGPLPGGVQQIDWDTRDDTGRMVPAGVFYYRIDADRERRSVRTVVVR